MFLIEPSPSKRNLNCSGYNAEEDTHEKVIMKASIAFTSLEKKMN
jgi:hypothetical protein